MQGRRSINQRFCRTPEYDLRKSRLWWTFALALLFAICVFLNCLTPTNAPEAFAASSSSSASAPALSTTSSSDITSDMSFYEVANALHTDISRTWTTPTTTSDGKTSYVKKTYLATLDGEGDNYLAVPTTARETIVCTTCGKRPTCTNITCNAFDENYPVVNTGTADDISLKCAICGTVLGSHCTNEDCPDYGTDASNLIQSDNFTTDDAGNTILKWNIELSASSHKNYRRNAGDLLRALAVAYDDTDVMLYSNYLGHALKPSDDSTDVYAYNAAHTTSCTYTTTQSITVTYYADGLPVDTYTVSDLGKYRTTDTGAFDFAQLLADVRGSGSTSPHGVAYDSRRITSVGSPDTGGADAATLDPNDTNDLVDRTFDCCSYLSSVLYHYVRAQNANALAEFPARSWTVQDFRSIANYLSTGQAEPIISTKYSTAGSIGNSSFFSQENDGDYYNIRRMACLFDLVTDQDDLQPGDILVYSGHVEVFAGWRNSSSSGSSHIGVYVLSCGNNDAMAGIYNDENELTSAAYLRGSSQMSDGYIGKTGSGKILAMLRVKSGDDFAQALDQASTETWSDPYANDPIGGFFHWLASLFGLA